MTNHFLNTAERTLPQTFINEKVSARSSWTIWHAGAGIGLLGGTLILFGAAFLSIFQFFYGEIPHTVWLYAVILPLWIMGTHCFDKVEKIEKARRIEHCRRNGMTND